MALATKRWTNGRFDEEEKLEHPRRLGDPNAGTNFPLGEEYAFGLSQASEIITIYPGTLILPGIGIYTSVETEVTLTGESPTFVYATHSRNHSTGLIIAANSIHNLGNIPGSNTTVLVFPLCEFTSDDEGTTWNYSKLHLAGLDIVMGSPL